MSEHVPTNTPSLFDGYKTLLDTLVGEGSPFGNSNFQIQGADVPLGLELELVPLDTPSTKTTRANTSAALARSALPKDPGHLALFEQALEFPNPDWERQMEEFLQNYRTGFRPVVDPHYSVTISNRTSSTVFSEIDIFYKRVNLFGVVFLQNINVYPGQTLVYDLGLCTQMESYVVGFFFDDYLVAQLPDSGNMTALLASQLNPTDTEWCADSWSIYDP